jgi:hypothetical protein
VARLRSGTVSPAAFDWNLLLRDTGRHGLAALKEIAASAGDDERSKLIATKAADILRLGSAPNQSQDSKIAMRALRERITVRPRGVLPDEALLEWLARPQADWAERKCLATPDACALWIIDLDHDSKPEAVLLWETGGTAEAWLYSQGPNGWHKEGPLHGTPRALSIWLSEIDAGRVALVPPRWPDLSVNGERLRVGP